MVDGESRAAAATAPMPPQLVLAKLNGQPIHVLYLIRNKDRILVRCYPGQQPSIVVKDRVNDYLLDIDDYLLPIHHHFQTM
jgi:hypothetical protein